LSQQEIILYLAGSCQYPDDEHDLGHNDVTDYTELSSTRT